MGSKAGKERSAARGQLCWAVLRPRALRPGGLFVAAGGRGVLAVELWQGRLSGARLRSRVGDWSRRLGAGGAGSRVSASPGAARRILKRACKELEAYFAGRLRTFRVPIDLSLRGTPFQRRVWLLLRDVPHGTTRTYGDLARFLGLSGGARAVGGALGRNPIPVILPCHRVIGQGGRLTGFSAGLALKRILLGLEEPRISSSRGRKSRARARRAAY
jgi:methylated-DNA-[protein]-cysteine S-methyltransferase